MNTIKLETPHYNILLMLNLNSISFTCKEVAQDPEIKEQANRTYDLPAVNIADFEYDSVIGYVYIYFEDKTFWQVKLESPNEIVIDHFKNDGDLITEIGAWDFYE